MLGFSKRFTYYTKEGKHKAKTVESHRSPVVFYTKDGRFETKNLDTTPIPYSELHRIDGPAIEWTSEHKEWWENGARHREDGPAIIRQDGKEWYKNGVRHRVDGPAAISKWDGNEDEIWYLNGKPLSKENVRNWIEENDIDLSTEEGQLAFILRWE